MEKTKQKKKTEGKTKRRSEGVLTPGYIIIPAEIEALPKKVLSSTGKRWYGHVYSFGIKGCWESQTKHARKYEVTDRTVIRWSRVLEGLAEILRLNLRGNWGCVWALRHPEVQKLKFLEHEGIKVRNPAYNGVSGEERPPTWVSGDPRHALQGTPDMGMYKPPTWMSDNYYRTKKLTSAAEPLPAEGQAQRLKEEELRRAERDTAIRAEFDRRMTKRRPGDLKEAARRADVCGKMNPKVVELNKGGMSISGAVERVYNENRKLIDGVQ